MTCRVNSITPKNDTESVLVKGDIGFLLRELKAIFPKCTLNTKDELIEELWLGDIVARLLNRVKGECIKERRLNITRANFIYEQNIYFNEIFETAHNLGIVFFNIGTEDFINRNEKLMISFLRVLVLRLKRKRENPPIPDLPLKNFTPKRTPPPKIVDVVKMKMGAQNPKSENTFMVHARLLLNWVNMIIKRPEFTGKKEEYTIHTFSELCTKTTDSIIYISILRYLFSDLITKEVIYNTHTQPDLYKRVGYVFEIAGVLGINTEKYTKHDIISGNFANIKLLIRLYNTEAQVKISTEVEGELKKENVFSHQKRTYEEYDESKTIVKCTPIVLNQLKESFYTKEFHNVHRKHLILSESLYKINTKYSKILEADETLDEVHNIDRMLQSLMKKCEDKEKTVQFYKEKYEQERKTNNDLRQKFKEDIGVAHEKLVETSKKRRWWMCE